MGWETLKNIIEFNKAQKTVEEVALENNECPYDVWPLNVNSDGAKACPICGRIWK
jgi:hypothetical protein